jgi:uncharacterized coiled-coil protein SlyX
MPPSLEERVAYLEGKVEEHSRGVGEVRELIVQLGGHVRALDQKVDRFRMELAASIADLDTRLTSRAEGMDARLNGRIDGLDQKMSRQFLWLVGIQIAVLLSVVGALLRG